MSRRTETGQQHNEQQRKRGGHAVFGGTIPGDQHLSWWYHWGLVVSRNAGLYTRIFDLRTAAAAVVATALALACVCGRANSASSAGRARVLIAYHPEATEAFKPKPSVISNMVAKAVIQLTGTSNIVAAWRSLVSTQDSVGIKVYSAPGANSGTRPEVTAAVVEGLLAAGVPPQRIIVWDKHRGDLRRAGYFELAERHGVRVEGSAQFGYDEKTFY